MVDELQYVSLREILSRVTRHTMLQDVDLEAVIQYTLEFFGLVGVPQIYEDKLAKIQIHNYKGELPCDIVRINQVRDERTSLAIRSMTDSFNTQSRFLPGGASFKTQNRVIMTSFPEGSILVSYKAIHTDADNLPMLPDDQVFLLALEAYIKMRVFEAKYDADKIKKDVLDRAEQQYFSLAGKTINRFKMPSPSEMQTITGMMHRMIPSTNEFENGFKGLGDKENYIVRKSHRR